MTVADARQAGSLFAAVTDNPYEGSTLNGVYLTFEAARTDVEERTVAERARKYGQDYGIDRSGIEEWQDGRRVARWERDPGAELDWRQDT